MLNPMVTSDQQRARVEAVRGFIVEGVVAAGKSTLIGEVQRRLVERYPTGSRLFLSEHFTDRVFEDSRTDGGPYLPEVLRHSSEICSLVAAFAKLKSESKFAHRGANASAPIFIERWVGSHVAHMTTPPLGVHGEDPSPRLSVRSLLTKSSRRELSRQCDILGRCGLAVLLLSVDPNELHRRLSSTLVHRNNEWRRYMQRYTDLEAAVDYYLAWQSNLFEFYKQSGIPVVVTPAVTMETASVLAAELVGEVVSDTAVA